MRTARRRTKNKFIKKTKSFLLYSFIAIVVVGFVVNFFFSNLIDYSFALARSGGVVDFKTDEKYATLLISSNTLNEIKEVSLILFDKKNSQIQEFILNPEIDLETKEGETVQIKNLLNTYKKTDIEDIKKTFNKSLATNIGLVYINNSDNYSYYRDVLLGNLSFIELYTLNSLEGVSVRDSFSIYSFSSGLDSKDKKQKRVSNLSVLDKEIRDIYLDSKVGEEALSITVVNTTQVNGLAKDFSRVILNMGGRVVDTTSNANVEPKSFLIYKNKSKTLDELADKIGISTKISADEAGLKYPEIIKSEIVLVVGLDNK